MKIKLKTMKKTIVTLLFIVITVMTFSQTKTAEIYRCSSLGFSTLDEKTGKWSEYEMKESNIIIKNNLIKNEITIGGGEKDIIIYLLRKTASDSKVDKDGDKYTIMLFDAYDQDARDCEWVKIDYPDYTNINFVIVYNNFKVYMECNIINN